jgi:uncharacterized membrane protein
VAFFFRAHDLGGECFDGDELYAVYLQGTSPVTVATVMARDSLRTNHPFLMTVPYLYWTALVGTGEEAVRALPLLLGLATVVLTFLLARRLGGSLAAFLAALALAVNPIHIAYSQEARHYALLVLLTVAAHLLLLRCLRTGAGRDRAWYFLVCLTALFTHYFAVPVLAAHGIIALWLTFAADPLTRRNALRAGATLALAIVPFVAWLPIMAHQASRPWPHLREAGFLNIFWALREVGGWGEGAWSIAPTAAAAGLIIVSLVAGRDRVLEARADRTGAPLPCWGGMFLVAGGLVSAAGLYFAAPQFVLPTARATLAARETDPAVIEEELFLVHYLLVALPLAAAVVGAGIQAWPRLVNLESCLPKTTRPRPLTASVFLGLLLVVPLLFVRLVGLIGVPFVQSSNLQVLAPLLCVAAGLGLAALLKARWGWAVAVPAALCLGVGAVQYETVSRPFGCEGLPLGMHTSRAWGAVARELKTGPGAGLPLYAAKTWMTDPMLYYFADQQYRRIPTADELHQAGSSGRFRFLHFQGDPVGEQVLDDLRKANARVRRTLRMDTLFVFEITRKEKRTVSASAFRRGR